MRQLQEGRADVEQGAHAVARQQLAARQVLVACALAAAKLDLGHALAQVVDQGAHAFGIGASLGGARIEFAS